MYNVCDILFIQYDVGRKYEKQVINCNYNKQIRIKKDIIHIIFFLLYY